MVDDWLSSFLFAWYRLSEHSSRSTTTYFFLLFAAIDMQVQVMEFKYNGTNGEEIESRLNDFLKHYDVIDVNVACSGNDMAVFVFYER